MVEIWTSKRVIFWHLALFSFAPQHWILTKSRLRKWSGISKNDKNPVGLPNNSKTDFSENLTKISGFSILLKSTLEYQTTFPGNPEIRVLTTSFSAPRKLFGILTWISSFFTEMSGFFGPAVGPDSDQKCHFWPLGPESGPRAPCPRPLKSGFGPSKWPENGSFWPLFGLKTGLWEAYFRPKYTIFRSKNRVFRGPGPGQRPRPGPFYRSDLDCWP